MAATDSLSEPSKTVSGPEINGQPTTLTLLNAARLSTSPFMPSLIQTINAAFGLIYASNPSLGLSGPRISHPDEITSVISDPESFILLLHHPESHHVVATASARPYHGPDRSGVINASTPWNRTWEVTPGCEEWELRLMATTPETQGKGLAGFMMGAVEEEIAVRRRRDGEKKLRIVLCTPRELTGEFYLRRGFGFDYETWRGEGYNFHIVHLSRDVVVK